MSCALPAIKILTIRVETATAVKLKNKNIKGFNSLFFAAYIKIAQANRNENINPCSLVKLNNPRNVQHKRASTNDFLWTILRKEIPDASE